MTIDHQDAIRRPRRIILNDDSEIHLQGADTPEGFIALRLGHTVDTQVDSIFWSFIFGSVRQFPDEYDTGLLEAELCHQMEARPSGVLPRRARDARIWCRR